MRAGVALALCAMWGCGPSITVIYEDACAPAEPIENTGDDACACPLPINFLPECRTMEPTGPDGACLSVDAPNGSPCRSGVGVCFGGICAAPNAVGQCMQGIGAAPWPLCEDAGDCDDDNPCTLDACPAPGCAPCLHVPVEDGTTCDAGMSCTQGACCDSAALP